MRKRWWIIDSLVVILIAFAVLNVSYDLTDGTTYYLGPINSILHGKAMLVNVTSQYGLLSIYTLAAMFKYLHIPLTFGNFSLMSATTYFIGYSLIYLVLRVWIKSRLLAIGGIIIIVLENYFIQVCNPLICPQVGFLRFGWFIPIMLLILARVKLSLKPYIKRIIRVTEVLLVVIAFYWTLDSGIYILGAYVVFTVVEEWNRGLRSIFIQLSYLLAGLLSGLIAITLFTFVCSHQWPSWYTFIQYTLLYSTNGIGMIPMPLVDWYLVFILVYVVAAAYIVVGLMEHEKQRIELGEEHKGSQELAILAFITTYGILQFIYYIGRSHSNNIQNTIVPLIIVVCWLVQWGLKKYASEAIVLASIGVIACIGTAAPYISLRGNTIQTVTTRNDVYQILIDYQFIPKYQEEPMIQSTKAIELVKGDKVAIVSVIDTFFLIETGKTNIIDDSDVFTQILLNTQIQDITTQLLTLRPETLFIDHDTNNPYSIYGVQMIQASLANDYHLVANVGYLDQYALNEK